MRTASSNVALVVTERAGSLLRRRARDRAASRTATPRAGRAGSKPSSSAFVVRSDALAGEKITLLFHGGARLLRGTRLLRGDAGSKPDALADVVTRFRFDMPPPKQTRPP